MHLILDNVEFMNHKHEVPINLSLCEALVEYRAYKTMRALLNYADFVDERLWKTEESKSRRQKKAKYATWAMQMKKKTNMNRSASNFSYLNHHHHLHPLSKPVVKSTKKSLIEKVDAYNVTALHWACEYRSTRLVSLRFSSAL